MLPERFVFTGAVPDDDLAAYYRWADAYVSLSEHEGFCVPLVEAMAADVPVLAYAAGAVPETLGGAGVLFAPKDLEFAAEMLGTLVYDRPVRERVLEGQRRRLPRLRAGPHRSPAQRRPGGARRMTRLPRQEGSLTSPHEESPSSSSATAPRSSAAPNTTAG